MASASSPVVKLLLAYHVPEFVLGGITRVIWGRIFLQRPHENQDTFEQNPAKPAPAPTSFPHSGLITSCSLPNREGPAECNTFDLPMPQTAPPILPLPALASSPPKTSIHDATTFQPVWRSSPSTQSTLSPPTVPSQSHSSIREIPSPFPIARLQKCMFPPMLIASALVLLIFVAKYCKPRRSSPSRKRIPINASLAPPGPLARLRNLHTEAPNSLSWRVQPNTILPSDNANASRLQEGAANAQHSATASKPVYPPPHKRPGFEPRHPLANVTNEMAAHARAPQTPIVLAPTPRHRFPHQMLPTPQTAEHLLRRQVSVSMGLDQDTPTTRPPRQQ